MYKVPLLNILDTCTTCINPYKFTYYECIYVLFYFIFVFLYHQEIYLYTCINIKYIFITHIWGTYTKCIRYLYQLYDCEYNYVFVWMLIKIWECHIHLIQLSYMCVKIWKKMRSYIWHLCICVNNFSSNLIWKIN